MSYRTRSQKPLPVEEARQVSILRVAEKLDLGDPVPAGTEFRVRCPLHDDHDPSLCLNVERNVFFCHVCAEGGDGIKLVERALGLRFSDAVRWLVGVK